jgi:uncharacterized protein YqcC (DUF446 family)
MSGTTSSHDQYSEAAKILDAIEAEMKRIGYWRAEPLPEEAYDFHQAFGMDTMTFSQWLQFILVPRVRQIIERCGSFPTNSMVGVAAIREFDGDGNAAKLIDLLGEFDRLFNRE